MRLTINGEAREVTVGNTDAASLLLRERLGLTGTKESCTTGACGACTVLVDGVAVLSCLLPAISLEEREVRTVEGLGPGLHPVQRALMAHDGLQCGFCTPGVVMQGVAFYTMWRATSAGVAPTRPEVADAFSGHLCRCGAYEGIIDAIAAACAGTYDADAEFACPRHDARPKVTGAARYTVDVHLDGMLHGAILRSPYAHAKVHALDASRASALPGVRAVIDILGEVREVRYVGQEVAAVAADTRHAAREALAHIVVEYERLPAAIGMDAAREPEAPRVYGWLGPKVSESELPIPPEPWHHNVRGPFFMLSQRPIAAQHRIRQAAGESASHVIQGHWRTQAQCHTPLEPHAAVARWTAPDELELHLSTQACADMAEDAAARWGLDPRKVTVLAPFVGGAFGGKAGITGESVAAVELARATGAPVSVVLQRDEELSVGGYRPGVELDCTLVADQNGQVTALSARAYTDGGVAVGSSVASLLRFALPKAPKLLLDFDVVSHAAPAKPFRGPGGPAACWAIERSLSMLADRMGLDGLSVRQLQPRAAGRQGALWEWLAALPAWAERDAIVSTSGRFRRGRGLAIGAWGYFVQPKSAVSVGLEGGRLLIATASQDLGTGLRSVLADTVCGVFGLPADAADVHVGDSRLVRGPISTGSRTTASIRPAALDGAIALKARLLSLAASRLGLRGVRETSGGIAFDNGTWSWAEVFARLPGAPIVTVRAPDRRTFLLPFSIGRFQIGRGVPMSAHVAEVEVDLVLGHVRVPRVWAALSVGTIASPPLARSQARGGVVQGVGYALYEERVIDPNTGAPLTISLDDYHIPGLADAPQVDVTFLEGGFDYVRGGGVGLGEISTIAVSAAIGNAVAHATGWQPMELPLRPPRVLAGLGAMASGTPQ